jgi:hypothetical protein
MSNSDTYDPSPGVGPDNLHFTRLLSQRDLSFTIPINYVTPPGVSFAAACFGMNVFQENSFGRCFSNLLAIGFRRFELDL